MNTFEVDGRVLHYITAGHGKPLVFVHGGAGSARQWKHLYQHFSRTRRVVAYDLIGCGANPPIAVDLSLDPTREMEAKLFSYEDDARALLAVIDAFGGTADVVAHSAGGIGAILAALERPAAIPTLTLFEPVLLQLLHETNHPAFAPVREFALNYRRIYQIDGPRAAMASFVDFWIGRGGWQSLPEPVQQSMVVGASRLYVEWGGLLYDESLMRADDLARLTLPVLYFRGEHTVEPMKRVTEIVLTQLRNSRFVIVPGANHMAPFTHATEVAADIEAHLKSAAASPVPAEV